MYSEDLKAEAIRLHVEDLSANQRTFGNSLGDISGGCEILI